LTDCTKLSNSGFTDPKAIVIIEYSYPDMPLDPAIQAFGECNRAPRPSLRS
jgi:hypothetical protein